MRAHTALRELICITLILVVSGCKKKTEESSAADFGGFKASVNMQPRNVSATQEQEAPAAPVLTPTSATIGPNGGTLASSDGKLSLSVPAGAFADDTVVQIAPDSNAPDESLGPVYQLSPEGTMFAQPVKLVWHLSDADLSTTNLDNLVVRTQTANGEWKAQPDVQRDEATHTISVATTHFSKWDLALTLRLVPTWAMTYVGDSIPINADVGETKLSPLPPDKVRDLKTAVDRAENAPDSSSDDDLLAAPERDYRKGIFRNAVWRVNGVPLGNSTIGSIDPKISFTPNDPYQTEKAAIVVAFYQAPTSVPSTNPVTVSFEFTVGKKKMMATALVHILPYEDHWQGDSSITQGDGTTVTSKFTFAPVKRPGGSPPSPYSPGGAVAGATVHQYEVLNGSVGYKGPKTVSGGACTLSIWPSSYTLGARPSPSAAFSNHNPKLPSVIGQGSGQGVLAVDMSNRDQWLVRGQGESQWLATYTTHCPNGDGSMPLAVHAAWWPLDPTNPGASTSFSTATIRSIPITINVNNGLGHGTVHLHYVDRPPLGKFAQAN